MKIGVQLIHKCGHDAYHVVDQPSTKNTRAFYAAMYAEVCPKCAKKKPTKKGGKK